MAAKIDKLSNQLKEFESENAELKKQVELSKDSIKTINSLQQELQRKDWVIGEANQQLKSMEDELSNVTLELQTVRNEAEDMRTSRLTLEKDLNEVRIQMTSLVKTNKDQETKIKQLLEELGLTKTAVGSSSKEYAELKSKYGELQDDLKAAKVQIMEMDKRYEIVTDNHTEEKRKLYAEINDLKAYNERLQKDIKNGNKNKSDIES